MEYELLYDTCEWSNLELFETIVEATNLVNRWLETVGVPFGTLMQKLQASYDPSYLANKYYTVLNGAFQGHAWAYGHWFGTEIQALYEQGSANFRSIEYELDELRVDLIIDRIHPRNGPTDISANPVIRNILDSKYRFVVDASLENARIKLSDAAEATRITAKLAYKAIAAADKGEFIATRAIEAADKAEQVAIKAIEAANNAEEIATRAGTVYRPGGAADRSGSIAARAIEVAHRAEEIVTRAENYADRVGQIANRAEEIATRAENHVIRSQQVVQGIEAQLQAIWNSKLQQEQAIRDAAFEATQRAHEAAREQTRQVAQRMADAAIEAAKRGGKMGYNDSDSQ